MNVIFFQFVTLLADQGGIWGLWLGVSLLSIFEIMEFFWDVLKLSIFNTYKSIQRKRGVNFKSYPKHKVGSGPWNIEMKESIF